MIVAGCCAKGVFLLICDVPASFDHGLAAPMAFFFSQYFGLYLVSVYIIFGVHSEGGWYLILPLPLQLLFHAVTVAEPGHNGLNTQFPLLQPTRPCRG